MRFEVVIDVKNIKHVREMAQLYRIHPAEYLDTVLNYDRKMFEDATELHRRQNAGIVAQQSPVVCGEMVVRT
jgi:hypothetical protein